MIDARRDLLEGQNALVTAIQSAHHLSGRGCTSSCDACDERLIDLAEMLQHFRPMPSASSAFVVGKEHQGHHDRGDDNENYRETHEESVALLRSHLRRRRLRDASSRRSDGARVGPPLPDLLHKEIRALPVVRRCAHEPRETRSVFVCDLPLYGRRHVRRGDWRSARIPVTVPESSGADGELPRLPPNLSTFALAWSDRGGRCRQTLSAARIGSSIPCRVDAATHEIPPIPARGRGEPHGNADHPATQILPVLPLRAAVPSGRSFVLREGLRPPRQKVGPPGLDWRPLPLPGKGWAGLALPRPYAQGSSSQNAGRSTRSCGYEAYASFGDGVSASTPALWRSARSETG